MYITDAQIKSGLRAFPLFKLVDANGLSATVIIFMLSDLPFTVSLTEFILSFLASIGVGILADIYPSKNATKIQPIM